MDTVKKIIVSATISALGCIGIVYAHYMRKADEEYISTLERINQAQLKAMKSLINRPYGSESVEE